VKEIRISANNTVMCEFFYKFDSSQKGWFPKPFETTQPFKHSDPKQGSPINVNESPCFKKGFR